MEKESKTSFILAKKSIKKFSITPGSKRELSTSGNFTRKKGKKGTLKVIMTEPDQVKRKVGSNKFEKLSYFQESSANKLTDIKESSYKNLIEKELEYYLRCQTNRQNFFKQFRRCNILLQKMQGAIYDYNEVEECISLLNQIVKQFPSSTLIYYTFSFSAHVSHYYGNFSLALFYFDQTLKKLSDKNYINDFQRISQLKIYKNLAQIFSKKCDYQLAKMFVYKYLRKAWFIKNISAQIQAYDMLGKVYLGLQNLSMSKFFHQRMCKGTTQTRTDLIMMSNNELIRVQNMKMEHAVYENIQVFVERDSAFSIIIDDFYRAQIVEYGKILLTAKKAIRDFHFCTHRSPNRKLQNFRSFQRKLIYQKSSKQIHFLKMKEAKHIKKLFKDFSKLVCDLNCMTSFRYINCYEDEDKQNIIAA